MTLPGLHSSRGLKSARRPPHLVQIRLREQRAHEGQLLEADAVLARERPPGRDDELEDLGRGGAHALDRARARARRRARSGAGCRRPRGRRWRSSDPWRADTAAIASSTSGQLRPRDDAVVQVGVGRHAPERAEGLLAPFQNLARSAVVAREAHLAHAGWRGQASSTRSACGSSSSASPSTSTSSTAAASSGKPAWIQASTARSTV
jgi:hypothetical protein